MLFRILKFLVELIGGTVEKSANQITFKEFEEPTVDEKVARYGLDPKGFPFKRWL